MKELWGWALVGGSPSTAASALAHSVLRVRTLLTYVPNFHLKCVLYMQCLKYLWLKIGHKFRMNLHQIQSNISPWRSSDILLHTALDTPPVSWAGRRRGRPNIYRSHPPARQIAPNTNWPISNKSQSTGSLPTPWSCLQRKRKHHRNAFLREDACLFVHKCICELGCPVLMKLLHCNMLIMCRTDFGC